MARAQADARNGYQAVLVHSPTGSLVWRLHRVANAGGTNTITLASGTLLSSGAAGTIWWIRLRVQGTSIQARFWREGTSEPTTWTASATDSFYTSGNASFGVAAASGLTSPFPDTGFKSFDAYSLS